MAFQLTLLVLAVSFAGQGSGFFLGQGLSKEIDECLNLIAPGVNNVTELSIVALKDVNVQSTCLQEYVWKFGGVNWADFNVSKEEVNVINGLTTDLVTEQHRFRRHVGYGARRFKRQDGPRYHGVHEHRLHIPRHRLVTEQHRFRRASGPGGPGGIHMPRNGYSVRREYRRLTDDERFYFHKAINKMKKAGVYDIFAKIHRGLVILVAHGGPGFFAWHRIFCALFEQALRNVNHKLALPYWDPTLDFEMDNPYNSIIFSAAFMGNGDGYVRNGPFAHWPTHIGIPLQRNIGAGSRLISKEDIMRLLTKCTIGEVTHPRAKPHFNAEIIHGGPHMWVGGHMSGLNSAGCDPLFFMYHCYIDYVYELFREHQRRDCGINPDTDFPLSTPSHNPKLPAAGLPPYRMIDGASSFWTRYWFRYEPSPVCNKWQPHCGSPYLGCNVSKGRCVSVPRRYEGAGGPGFAGAGGYAVGNPSPAQLSRATAEVAPNNFGPTFDAPPSDGRSG